MPRLAGVDTDAYQGTVTWVSSRHLTRAEAEAAIAEMHRDEYEGEDGYSKIEMRPYREGEDDSSWKGPSLLELHMDNWAKSECCPEWAQ